MLWPGFFFQASFDTFFGNQGRLWRLTLPLVLSLFVAVWFLDAVKPRAVLLSLLYTGQTLAITATILARYREFRRRVTCMLASGYVLAGVSFMVRGLSVFLSPLPNPDPFAAGPAQNVAMLLSVPSLIACTFGFVLLHRERGGKRGAPFGR